MHKKYYSRPTDANCIKTTTTTTTTTTHTHIHTHTKQTNKQTITTTKTGIYDQHGFFLKSVGTALEEWCIHL